MVDQNISDFSESESPPTTFAILESQREEIEKLGITCSAKKIGLLNTLGVDFALPVATFENAGISGFINKLLSAGTEASPSKCLVDGVATIFIALQGGVASIDDLYPGQEHPIEWQDTDIEHALSDIEEFAKCAGGLTVHFHAPPGSKFHEPFRDEADVVHIFVLTTPMPTRGQTYPEKMFGMSAKTSAGFYIHLNPTPGRGVVLSDGKVDIAQIIGNNVYLLYDPVLLCTVTPENGSAIFRKSLALIFSHLLTKKDPEDEEDNAPTEENVRALIGALVDDGLSAVRKEMARDEECVRKAEESLRSARQTLADTRRMYNIFTKENFWVGPLRANIATDRERILTHDKVACVRIIPKSGIEVDTKDIVIAHNRKRHCIGRFTIRFEFGADFRIWPIVTHHPKSVPHPHISAWNGPCLGNAKETIDDAVIECRYGDALEYLLDWLENGYSPELIIWNKVEEWPIENDTLDETQKEIA